MSILNDLVSDNIATEVNQVVRTYEIHLKGNDDPPTLRVKILRRADDCFVPSLSHAVQGLGMAGPYSPSWHPCETIEEAEDQVRSHISTSYKPNRGDKWVLDELS